MSENQQFGFRPGPTQTRLYSHRRWLEAGNFGFRKWRNCTICVAKTNAMICQADVRLYFHLCRLLVFPCGGSFVSSNLSFDIFSLIVLFLTLYALSLYAPYVGRKFEKKKDLVSCL